jgi:hypothetical protein
MGSSFDQFWLKNSARRATFWLKDFGASRNVLAQFKDLGASRHVLAQGSRRVAPRHSDDIGYIGSPQVYNGDSAKLTAEKKHSLLFFNGAARES